MSDVGECAAVVPGRPRAPRSGARTRRRASWLAPVVVVCTLAAAACSASPEVATSPTSTTGAGSDETASNGSSAPPGSSSTSGTTTATDAKPVVEKVATLARVNDVDVAPDGTPWVTDANNSALVELADSGPVTHYTGEQTSTDPESEMSGLAIASDGTVWFATRKGIHRLDPETDTAELVVPAASTELAGPTYRLAMGPKGVLFIGDVGQDKIFRLDGTTVVHVAGAGGAPKAGAAAEVPALEGVFGETREVAVGSDGTIYVADDYSHVVHAVSPEGVMTTFAGGGAVPPTAKDVPAPKDTDATDLALQSPYSIWVVDETVSVVDSYTNTVLALGVDGGVEVPLVPGAVTGGTTTWGAPGVDGEIFLVVAGGNVVRVTWPG